MKSSFLPLSGIMHSNEDFDSTENTMSGADAIAPDETDTLASAVSEISADEAALGSANDQMDSASVAADGLETIAEQVAEANEGEGIDEKTAEIIETSVESLLKVAKIGVQYRQLGIPSSESFGNKSNRAALGRQTVEALEISAKKIWKSIIDAIKKSIEWVKNFFNKIFGAAERLQRRAQSLKESTTKIGDKKAEDKTFENDSVYNAVMVNGSPAKAANINEIGAEAKKIFAAQKSFASKFASLELGKDNQAVKPTPGDYGMTSADTGTAKRVTAESDVAVFVTKRLPGEKVVFLALPKADGGNAKEVGDAASKIKAGAVTLVDKKVEGKTLEVLSVDEIRGFADAVEKAAGEVVAYKQGLSEVNANKSKFISAIEKFLAKGDGKEEGDSKGDAEKKAKAQATMFRKLIDEPATSFASHAVQSMAGALQYAELSARKYVA